MKKIILSIFVISAIFGFGSCSEYTVSTFQSDTMKYNDCPTPIYIETMSVSEKLDSSYEVLYNDGFIETRNKIVKVGQNGLTLVSLLAFAREKHGKDVTIHNVRWDIEKNSFFFLRDSKRTGVVFDVVRCK